MIETVESILKQPCKDFDIIIIDNRSTDKSFKIAQDFASAFTCVKIIHTENRGVSHARNIEIENASGRYIFQLSFIRKGISKWKYKTI